ncbi:MAG TPA: hypothetical protein VGP07_24355 [Polyangia bacterium]
MAVDVTVDATVTGLASVRITATEPGGASVYPVFESTNWQTTNSFGVYLPSGVSGIVTVSALGLDANGVTIAMSDMARTASVTPGQKTTAVQLHLVAVTLGGTGGAGGTMGGAGGTSSGGVGGGATGGLGGTGMMVGSGGVVGTGGTAGMMAGGGKGGGVGGAGAAGKSGRAWQGATLAEHNDLSADYVPAVAVDAKGNAVVAYEHGRAIWANHYDVVTGTWGTEGPIDSSAMTYASWTNVAVDKNGNWLVAWMQDPSVPQHGIWQSTSSDGVTWSAPSAIATVGNLYEVTMAMNQDGVAVVVWTENVPPDNHFTLTGSVRVNGAWSAPHVLKAAMDDYERNAAVTVTSAGVALVAWEQEDDGTSTNTSVFQARFTGGAWTTAALVESYDGGDSGSSGVASNSAGQSIITWVQNTSSTSELWAQRIPATGTPEAPVKITEGGNIDTSQAPSVTLDESGAATVTWAFEVKTKYDVYTARAVWGQPWQSAMAMETDDAATDDNLDEFEWVTAPMVRHDGAGNVVLTWRKRTGPRFDMWGRNYDVASDSWGPATLLETKDDNTVYDPTVAVAENGIAVACWYYGTEDDIWTNVYR